MRPKIGDTVTGYRIGGKGGEPKYTGQLITEPLADAVTAGRWIGRIRDDEHGLTPVILIQEILMAR